MTRIRHAESADLAEVERIHAEAAETIPATFDEAGRPAAWWQATLESCDAEIGHLLLVAVAEDGTVMGYAKSGQFRDKAAYRTTCETSIYLGADHRGSGVGGAVYRELIARLDRGPLRLAVAGVTQPNVASDRLHRALGFVEVGTFTGVGIKFGRPWDVLWYQRRLGGPR
ncbi:MAG: N-acetyltransferase [Solirubrobacterales bacterium]|nr:N-acetyltransferase [Solirubrobacterales bacterium]